MSEEIAAKLDEARALIEKGWTRGSAKKDGRYCLVGAMAHVTPLVINSGNRELRRGAFECLLKATGKPSLFAMSRWNDAQPSKRPVILAFRKAAELARAS